MLYSIYISKIYILKYRFNSLFNISFTFPSNTKYKTVRSLDGYDANGSGYISFNSGLWMSTSPITSISFSLTSFTDGAQFALYGVK